MNWKKITLITVGIVLAAYIGMAMTVFNEPDEAMVCRDVRITIEEGIVEGFLTKRDVKQMLATDNLSPIGKSMDKIDLRQMEEVLQAKELIERVECWKTQDSVVRVSIHQRIPIIRVISSNGENYYVDSHGNSMPRADYSCHLIVATGAVSKAYAKKVLAPLANVILQDKFWKNEIVQLNVLGDGSVEMVPRVGNHIAYLGQPTGVTRKLERLRKFYVYGLSQAGWNRYSRVSVEYDNQVVCKRRSPKEMKANSK